jgi:hypothetical protein
LRDLLAIFLQIALGIVLPAWIVKRDERRLSDKQLERAWPPATFWCAVVTFGLICLPIHFWRTRRSVTGLGLGLIWLVAAGTLQVELGRLMGG